MVHHSNISDSNCTNSNSATVKCACAAAAAVVAAAVVGTVGLHRDPRLEHVASLAELPYSHGARCFCQYLEHKVQHLS